MLSTWQPQGLHISNTALNVWGCLGMSETDVFAQIVLTPFLTIYPYSPASQCFMFRRKYTLCSSFSNPMLITAGPSTPASFAINDVSVTRRDPV